MDSEENSQGKKYLIHKGRTLSEIILILRNDFTTRENWDFCLVILSLKSLEYEI